MDTTQRDDCILRRPDVERLTALSRSTIYAAVAAGTFPAPIRIGRSAVGWRASAIQEWIAKRPVATNTKSRPPLQTPR